MKIIADFHIHSKYSRATSKSINLDNLAIGAKQKGINLLATGDFTHPAWVAHLRENLKEAEPGLFKNKNNDNGVRFILSSEISCIFKHKDKVRKMHVIVLAPSFDIVLKINSKLAEIGNIHSDGRPILGIHAKDLLDMIMAISPDCMFIPAHCFTPWFSIFGSKSGYDSVEECFGESSKYIYALETGLSADPSMIWRNKDGERLTLISNSDAHSVEKLGREANVFDCKMDYFDICDAIKKRDNKRFLYTIEFFPDEGKYHYDGHRDCKICMHPKDSKANDDLCPVCGSPLTIGVLSRAQDLAIHPEDFIPKNAIPYKSIIPLPELIAKALKTSVASKKTKQIYKQLTDKLGCEFDILLDISYDDINNASDKVIADAILMARNGEVEWEPGYDGVFGKIKSFNKVINKQIKLL